jgi:hypothetical protein
MTSATLRKEADMVSITRMRVMGILFLLIGAAIWILFGRGTNGSAVTTFVMVPGGSDARLADWKLPSSLVINGLAFACAFFGGVQLARAQGFGKRTNAILSLVVGAFIFAFLVWAAADQSLNLAGLLNATLEKAVPLTLGALSGILCERSGVVNIAIEGMMLGGAMVSTVVASVTDSMWLGVLGALIVGALLAWVHGVLLYRQNIYRFTRSSIILGSFHPGLCRCFRRSLSLGRSCLTTMSMCMPCIFSSLFCKWPYFTLAGGCVCARWVNTLKPRIPWESTSSGRVIWQLSWAG